MGGGAVISSAAACDVPWVRRRPEELAPRQQPSSPRSASAGVGTPSAEAAPGLALVAASAHPGPDGPDEQQEHQHQGGQKSEERPANQRLLFHIGRLVRRTLGNFERRIIARLTTPPANLLWLAAGTPELHIPQRKALAAELLEMLADVEMNDNPEVYHPTALALARRFRAVLTECMETGGMMRRDQKLFMVFRLISGEFRVDAQELESMMNSIKMIVAACPGILQPGLDARMGCMKDFREATGGQPRKNLRFSRDVKPVVERMVDSVEEANPERVLNRIDRFSTPPPCLRWIEPLPYFKFQPVLEPSTPEALKWARKWNRSWMGAHKASLDKEEMEILHTGDRWRRRDNRCCG